MRPELDQSSRIEELRDDACGQSTGGGGEVSYRMGSGKPLPFTAIEFPMFCWYRVFLRYWVMSPGSLMQMLALHASHFDQVKITHEAGWKSRL